MSPAVLIPRPETELLVEKVIALAREGAAPRMIDLGTGSGCIALTLAAELPQAQIVAVDVSAAALAVAQENARRLQVAARVEFHRLDMCAPAAWAHLSHFDVIVSNPPYVLQAERDSLQPEVRDHEPQTALFVEEDGLALYRCMLTFCQSRLNTGGWVACEMASPRSASIAKLFRQAAAWEHFEIVNDYAGLPRHIVARLQR